MKMRKNLKRALALVLCLCWMVPSFSVLKQEEEVPFPKGGYLINSSVTIQK